MVLEEISGGLHTLRGVGPASLKTLHTMGIASLQDLVWHLPRDYEDRQTPRPFASAVPGGGWINTRAVVTGHERIGPPGRQTVKILLEDDSGKAALVCFGRDFLARQLPPGSWIRVCGQGVYRYAELQLASFEFEAAPQADLHSPNFGHLLPRYPLGGELNQGFFRRLQRQIQDVWLQNLQDFLPPDLIAARGLMDRSQALRAIHFPADTRQLARARTRLVHEELLVFQLRQLMLRARRRGPAAGASLPPAAPPLPGLSTQLLASLPFSLTPGQEASLEEIRRDLAAPWPMARLLQGDVGCGKTLVALLACLEMIASGHQAAILVPTVLLARQHARNASRLLEPLGIRIALVAGKPGKGRPALQEAIAAGDVDLVVGTHGLFSDQLEYRDLGLVVVDEQHRFGVAQRQAMYRKAAVPNILMMSATPIPQTLALTLFGDMDSSVIGTLPPGRLPIQTHLARMGNEQKVYDWVRRDLARGRQAYFVYPVIQGDGGEDDLKDAQTMYEQLGRQIFPQYRCGMIHSRLEEEEKEGVMAAFLQGDIAILVATSVVEVGVDVANATTMVIEHAERFGLAALHQLRGRVGRGEWQSYCFLVYREPLDEAGKGRLKAMKEHADGFRIAQEDLELRGPGDLRGLRQSGQLRLRVADLARDGAIMQASREDALAILEKDPALELSPHQGLARVIAIQEQREATMSGLEEEPCV